MPGSSLGGIFLSYRREDAAAYARLLQFHMRERFPDAQVFMDLDSIEAGLDFTEVIRQAVESCAVLVALIGRQWATLVDEEGRRRLDNPDDFVRFELRSALERGVRVIPVLVDGAQPPRQQQLPPELQQLARLNALELSYGRIDYDADRLLGLIQRVLTAIGDQVEADRVVPDGGDRVISAEADRKTEAELDELAEQANSTGNAGDARGARDQYAGLLPVYERLLGAEHLGTLIVRHNLAHWTGQAGDAAQARDQFATLLPIRERVSGPEHPDALLLRNELARWTGEAGYAGDAAQARDQLAALLPIRERVSGPEHPDTLATRYELAQWTNKARRKRG